MSAENTQTSSKLVNTASTNDAVFSVETRDAAMKVISVAEARNMFSKAGMTSQSVGAYCRSLLGSIGIELGGSQAEHADNLVQLRTKAAANEETFKKAA